MQVWLDPITSSFVILFDCICLRTFVFQFPYHRQAANVICNITSHYVSSKLLYNCINPSHVPTNSYTPPADLSSACSRNWYSDGLSDPIFISIITDRPLMVAEISAVPLRVDPGMYLAVIRDTPDACRCGAFTIRPLDATRVARCPDHSKNFTIACVSPLAVLQSGITGLKYSPAVYACGYFFLKSCSWAWAYRG